MAKKKGVKALITAPVKTITGIPKAIKKSATAKNAKSYGKVALALTTAGLGYAAVQETVRGTTRALVPSQSANLEWRWTNTEVGLAGQTLLFVAASSMASKTLQDMKLLTKAESQFTANAGIGLAVGRHLMGTSLLDFGKRFEYLLDGEIGSALFPGRGPAITTPANAVSASEIVTHNNTRDSFTVENAYLANRVDRGMPYSTPTGNKEVKIGPSTSSFLPHSAYI